MSAANGTSFVFCHCADSDDTSLGAGIFGQPGGPCAGPATRASAFDYPGRGTVFLDEVRDLSLPMQSQLLRALQEFDVRHPAGMDVRKDSKKGDVRFVAATSGDLRTELAADAFREDLLLRLNPIEIHVPALAQRAGDIPILIRHFLRMYGHADGKNLRGLTRRAQIALFDHDWSGNVGELESVISDAAAAASEEFIDLGDLSPDLTAEVRQPVSPSPTLAEVVWQPLPLAEVRRIHIQQVLVACKGNRVRAAQTLGIGRTSLYRYMKRASLAKGDAASASAPS
jgi:DNA-binding NtrC family response regulator